jgi:hypothetical protein
MKVWLVDITLGAGGRMRQYFDAFRNEKGVWLALDCRHSMIRRMKGK